MTLPTRDELLAAVLPIEVDCGRAIYRYATEAARDHHLVAERRVMTTDYDRIAKLPR